MLCCAPHRTVSPHSRVRWTAVFSHSPRRHIEVSGVVTFGEDINTVAVGLYRRLPARDTAELVQQLDELSLLSQFSLELL